jgi:hypothetical protein
MAKHYDTWPAYNGVPVVGQRVRYATANGPLNLRITHVHVSKGRFDDQVFVAMEPYEVDRGHWDANGSPVE